MIAQPTAGVLLHPTSLPGPFGIGDMGPEAFQFVDWLADAGQGFWQFLPLGPPGDGDSPYQSLSAFAGNPLLISPEMLVEDGLLSADQLAPVSHTCGGRADRVDFPAVEKAKNPLLQSAFDRFNALPASHALYVSFDDYRDGQAMWLNDFALFMALREINGEQAWTRWQEGIDSNRRPLPGISESLRPRIRFHTFVQWVFDRQWDALRRYANGRGVRLIGDLPIYVSHDGADVWANRELFQLDASGQAAAVAGVPPDYFSETGQLWNNPLYNWDANRQQGYRWWIHRVRGLLGRLDFIRLDHFRGYQAYWAVPAGATTAEQGQWVPGPGAELFEAIDRAMVAQPDATAKHHLCLPLIAENLGYITPDVDALQQRLGLPGMIVLQFALTGAIEGEFDPAAIDGNTVLYTGTHDNNTTRGWLEEEVSLQPEQLQRVRRFVSAEPATIAWELIELAWRCSAHLAIAPAQDLLQLGSQSRMNRPGTNTAQHPNWSWRMERGVLNRHLQERLLQLTADSGRMTPERIAANQ